MKRMKFRGYLIIMVIVGLLSFPASVLADIINLGWNPPTEGGPVDGYYVYYGLTNNLNQMTKVGPIYDTNYRLEVNRSNSETYYIYFTAFNSAGEGPSSDVKTINIKLSVVQ